MPNGQATYSPLDPWRKGLKKGAQMLKAPAIGDREELLKDLVGLLPFSLELLLQGKRLHGQGVVAQGKARKSGEGD